MELCRRRGRRYDELVRTLPRKCRWNVGSRQTDADGRSKQRDTIHCSAEGGVDEESVRDPASGVQSDDRGCGEKGFSAVKTGKHTAPGAT